MNVMLWFSSKIRFVCLIANRGATRYRDSIYLFQASDYDDAFERVLQLAKSREEVYENDEGLEVKWRTKEIVSLDQIGEKLVGVLEVYSEPVPLEIGTLIPCGTQLHPEVFTANSNCLKVA